jgi:Methyltransferase domain
MRDLRAILNHYFNGDPTTALEAAFVKVRSRFAAHANVRIIRADVAAAASDVPDRSLDLIYLDANHTYEFVLRDLILWFPKLRQGGLFAFNDFCDGRWPSRQNLGVIPAFGTFSKRVHTFPIALSALKWSDFYFSNVPTSPLIEHFTRSLLSSRCSIVDVPAELLLNFHHRVVLSNGTATRLLPVLRAVPFVDEGFTCGDNREAARVADDIDAERRLWMDSWVVGEEAMNHANANHEREARLEQETAALAAISPETETRLQQPAAALATIKSSTSWRITQPIRRALDGHPGLARLLARWR